MAQGAVVTDSSHVRSIHDTGSFTRNSTQQAVLPPEGADVEPGHSIGNDNYDANDPKGSGRVRMQPIDTRLHLHFKKTQVCLS